MGGKESKRKRALLRAGFDPEVAALKAAEEFVEVRRRQHELEKNASGTRKPKSKRIKEKRTKETITDLRKEDAHVAEEKQCNNKKRKDPLCGNSGKHPVDDEVAKTAGKNGRGKDETCDVELATHDDVNSGTKQRKKRAKELKPDEAQKDLTLVSDNGAVVRDQSKSSTLNKAASTEVSGQKRKGDPKLTVFVGQLPFDVSEKELEQHFHNAGIEDVVSVRLLTDSGTKKSRGMAFVQFANEQHVLAALSLHQSELNGRWINVERSGRKSSIDERSGFTVDRALSVFVAQLPYTADRDSIREHFEQAGVEGIVAVKTLSEKGTNRKGMAFVQLSNEDGVRACLELDGSDFGGRLIRVERSGDKAANQKGSVEQ